VSEGGKKSGDPFEGLDWDKELDDWDKSTTSAGDAPPPASKLPDSAAEKSGPNDSQQTRPPGSARPLYRPPNAARSGAFPSPLPPREDPLRADRSAEALPLGAPSSRDEDDHQTVIASVSSDLLAELEAAGIKRAAPKKPAPPKPPVAPIELDLGALDESTASGRDAAKGADDDVVTSLRVDDPPPASLAGPRLLVPDNRDYSATDDTQVARRDELQAEIGALLAKQSTKQAPNAPPKPPPVIAQIATPIPEPLDMDSFGVSSGHDEVADPFAADEQTIPLEESADPFSVAAGSSAPASTRESDAVELHSTLESGEEIAADALLEASEPAVPVQPRTTPLPSRTSSAPPARAVSVPPPVDGPGSLLESLRPRSIPPAVVPDAKPASAYLDDAREAWKTRAESIASAAREEPDKTARTRGFVIASELAAIAGDAARALELADEAWAASPNDLLAVRQLRQLLAAEGRWDDAAPLLEGEAKSNAAASVRVHSALLAADAARMARAAPEEAAELWSLAIQADDSDVRAYVSRAIASPPGADVGALESMPERPSTQALVDALRARAEGGEPKDDVALADVRDALEKIVADGGVTSLAEAPTLDRALDQLSKSGPLSGAARWLGIALASNHASTRAQAIARLGAVPAGKETRQARLALAIDARDAPGAIASAASREDSDALAATLLAVAFEALSGDATTLRAYAAKIADAADVPGAATIARAVALASGDTPPQALGVMFGIEHAARLARALHDGTTIDRDDADAGTIVPRGLALADDLRAGRAREALDSLREMVSSGDVSTEAATLARVVAAVSDGREDEAIDALRAALAIEPTSGAIAEALAALDVRGSADLLLDSARAIDDERRASTIAVTVALSAYRADDFTLVARAASVANERTENHPVGALLADLCARRAGEIEPIVESLRARQAAANDPIDKAELLVREALLLASHDPATALERALEAMQQALVDASVRALHEAISGEKTGSRADVRAGAAARLQGPARARAWLMAAREAELANDVQGAETLADEAVDAGAGTAAELIRARARLRTESVARHAESLLDRAKSETDPVLRREAYDALADLDQHARGDAIGASMWHRAILEASPNHLPSLRRLEHLMISSGREEELEPVSSALATTLVPDARDPHVELASRLRLRPEGAAWTSIAPLIEAAAERDQPSLWTLRALDSLARLRGDDRRQLAATERLLARATRPAEQAALATRAAEASFRLGDEPGATRFLEQAIELDPLHPTALASIAELRRKRGDHRAAAEAIEALAGAQSVAMHRLEEWYSAATLWLDQVHDDARGRPALERCAEIDLGYADVFERLVKLARERSDREELRALYGRRLETLDARDPSRPFVRLELARALLDLDDRAGAREVVDEAFDAHPDVAEIARLAVDLAEKEADWPALERALARLGALAEATADKLALHRRLADLYEGALADPRRAESALREIQSLAPDDDDALQRLTAIYVQLRDGDQAIEVHKERIALASEPTLRRALLLELARLLDEVVGDTDQAVRAIEQARAIDPSDLGALVALAELLKKHGREDRLEATLDAAVADARAKLNASPVSAQHLELLVKLLDLRGETRAQTLVQAALDGVRGTSSSLVGADDGASLPELDELLARAGEALEKSVPVDLRALKAAKLSANQPAMRAKIDAAAHSFGLSEPDVVLSRAMPWLCLPVGARPFQIVVGEALLTVDDEPARRFSLARTMKLCSAHCAVLVRVPPSELRLFLDALLHYLQPTYPAPPIDAERLDEITKRLQRFIPKKEEPEVRALAAEVIANGLPSAELLASAAATWGDRVALLSVGDLAGALRGVAWTLGLREIPATDPASREAWIDQNVAARDLVAFAESPAYARARVIAGVDHG
jgi:hypothetical protein